MYCLNTDMTLTTYGKVKSKRKGRTDANPFLPVWCARYIVGHILFSKVSPMSSSGLLSAVD